MALYPENFSTVLFDVILFECACHNEAKYTVRELAVAFADAHQMFLSNSSLKTPCDVYIKQHKLHTQQGLKQYMLSLLPRGNIGYFPFRTPIRTPMMTMDPYDYTNTICGDHFVDLPACSRSEAETFLQRYGEMVPSAVQDDIAAVMLYLRDHCWRNRRGSAGESTKLSSLNGLLGVTKYSSNHTAGEQIKSEGFYIQGTVQQQDLIQRHQQEEEEDQELECLEKEVRGMSVTVEHTAYHQRLQLQINAAHHTIISQYLDKLKLQAATADTRYKVETLRQALETILRKDTRFQNAEVRLFGSFESGLSTLTSDADFTVFNLVGLSTAPIHELARALQASGYGPIKTIANARVPIVCFTSRCGIRCDMSINQPMGVFNSQLIHAYQKIDARFLGIWFGLRSLADKHGILGGSTGYLSSYALTMMLIVFLQDITSPPVLPRLQQQIADKMVTRTIDGYHCAFDKEPRIYTALAAKNTKTQGELLKELCRYFGHTFSYLTQEVNPCLGVIRNRSVSPPPRSLRDSRPKDWPICVLDPFITGRNVAGNCRPYNVVNIQQCFQSAYDALLEDDINRAFKVQEQECFNRLHVIERTVGPDLRLGPLLPRSGTLLGIVMPTKLAGLRTVAASFSFGRALLDVILFECAGYREAQNDRYLIRDLAVAFAHARDMFINNHRTNNLKHPGDVFIRLHKLHTHIGLREYMRLLPRGNNAYFPYPTPVRCSPLDANGNTQEDHVSLPACTSREVNDFLQNYAENVPSTFHDDIAAVVLYLRNNCWRNRKGSGGGSAELSANGVLGVTKYSKVHNAIKRRKAGRQQAHEIERQQAAARHRQQLAQEETRREAEKLEQ
ncbi:hypothetical protein BGZ47_007169 [Haplosporangium gracile]|nr:hypothetical protein BGZ47_007169 [Haplosporangium gracile]